MISKIRNKGRQILQNNVLLQDVYCRVRNLPKIIKYERLVKKFSKIDSIMNCDELAEMLKKHPEVRSITAPYTMNEGSLYGNVYWLYKYAGKRFKSYIYTMETEHAAKRYSYLYGYEGTWPVRISQGPVRNELYLHNANTRININVGPYIQYAEQYYTQEQISELKKKEGKILLFFPTHTSEYDERNRLDENLMQIISQKSKDYDSVWVCVFYRDLENEFINKYRKLGYRIVSAGLRTDPLFSSRLKTIIEVSDKIIFDEVSSGMAYAFYMKKPFEHHLESALNIIELDAAFEVATKQYLNEFINYDKDGTPEKFFDKYWGNDITLSQEEMRDLLDGLKYILRASKYKIDSYEKGIGSYKKQKKRSKILLQSCILNESER